MTATAGTSATDQALDEALDRIRELSGRLWEVRARHHPRPAGRLRRTRLCAECGHGMPCPTVRAAG